MNKNQLKGHLAATAAVSVWGTTFVASKVLLQEFSSMEILIIRFIISALALLIICPRSMKLADRKQEIFFAGAGATGVSLYYLLEIIALNYTFTANVSVIISMAPFFTAVLLLFGRKEKESFHWTFLAGFILALVGIVMISFNGAAFQASPIGDVLALLAALSWSFYALFLKKVNSFGYPNLLATRRILLWGLAFLIPPALIMDFSPELSRLKEPMILANYLFLGILAGALCFLFWNYAVTVLGALKTSVYIYLTPVITVVTGAIVLQEPLTGMLVGGTALTIVGLAVSEYRKKE